MAKNAAYKLLKEHTTTVELAMKSNLEWFTTKLNTDEFPVLSDDLARAMKNPASPLRPDQKATQMFEPLLDWVDGDPSGLDRFVEILKIEPVKFGVLIQNLDGSKLWMVSTGRSIHGALLVVIAMLASMSPNQAVYVPLS
jgi:hypothetical protein